MRRTLVLVSFFAGMLGLAATGLAARPLQTAFLDPPAFTGPEAEVAFAHAKSAGATAVRLQLIWQLTAPARRPKRFTPTDPAEPAYRFGYLDEQLERAKRSGLEPIVYIETAPKWALVKNHGFLRPDPAAFGEFALAAAKRYSGHFRGLPRVRYWQVWNEPNKVAGPKLKKTAPDWYRDMVESMAAAVHVVHADNAVLAGGLAPFGRSTVVAPLDFMRRLLCMSKGATPKPTCSSRTPFEIWSTHPYTVGGPTHKSGRPDDVSLGDLPEMKELLDAAVRAHQVRSRARVRFWVTEFTWDSKPPDPKGVPMELHARWVSEALYRMWSAGVSLCVWFRLSDDAVGDTPYQSGLYFHSASLRTARPKLSLEAFRFPFVALREGDLILVWGRTPGGKRGRVIIEQEGAGWTRVGALAADRYGIFSGRLLPPGDGDLRARLVGEGSASVPFSLTVPPDRLFNPFGS
jgi:hypothetical protein